MVVQENRCTPMPKTGPCYLSLGIVSKGILSMSDMLTGRKPLHRYSTQFPDCLVVHRGGNSVEVASVRKFTRVNVITSCIYVVSLVAL